jgi:hypothetical protein
MQKWRQDAPLSSSSPLRTGHGTQGRSAVQHTQGRSTRQTAGVRSRIAGTRKQNAGHKVQAMLRNMQPRDTSALTDKKALHQKARAQTDLCAHMPSVWGIRLRGWLAADAEGAVQDAEDNGAENKKLI